MRVLLTEGSGLTSRQVATQLGERGHEVEVLSSTPLCLARFTRHVRRVHAVPSFGDRPLEWFKKARAIARARRVDVILPTQESVTVLSAFAAGLGVAAPLPPFAALRRVQDKLSASETLRAAGVPQPEARVVRSPNDLEAVGKFPVYLKQPVGTASTGVHRVASREQLYDVATGLGLGGGLLVQQEARGELAMVQAIADHGRLVAFHANLRIREGIGGGAATKESVALPDFEEHTRRLVRELGWNGAVSMDVVLGSSGAVVIDVNPRLVEPMNAWHAGVDLLTPLLELALGRHPPSQPPGRKGVRTHQLLLSVLGSVRDGGRLAMLRELADAAGRRGPWSTGREELTPCTGNDWRALLPVALAVSVTLAVPSAWQLFHRGAVGPYALTPKGWQAILRAADSGSGPP